MDPLGPLFVHPEEPTRLWILVVMLAVATIAIALVALVRGRLPAALSSSGLLLLPIFAYVLGDLMVLEESKRVDFCGSCHEPMAPVVEAMFTDGESLSASHYQKGAVSFVQGCYQCHSGYGIWGNFSAKTAGVNHMLHNLTGRYELPLAHAGPFDIDACLDCHAETGPFRAAEAHHDPDIQEALLTRELGCSGLCHPAAHLEDALLGVEHWESRSRPDAGDGPS